jgi:hypothetical protein
MARFKAQVWVSGEHPYPVEVNAVSVFAAKKQIVRREGVKEHEVNRVFQIRDDTTSSDSNMSVPDVSGSMGIFILGATLFALVMWTPWVLMLLGGTAGTWIGEKVTRTSVDEARGKAGAILITLIMLGGGFGFMKGHEFQTYVNSDTPVEQTTQQ